MYLLDIEKKWIIFTMLSKSDLSMFKHLPCPRKVDDPPFSFHNSLSNDPRYNWLSFYKANMFSFEIMRTFGQKSHIFPIDAIINAAWIGV